MAEKYMYTIAENLNVINKKVGAAFKDKDPGPVRKMTEDIVKSQPDYVDINLGPAKKNGAELMPWVVNIVQEVTDIPIVLDTSNIDAIEAGLKVCKKRALINSIMCRPERYNAMLPLVKTYDADWVALMWGPTGMARDENERAELTTELLMAAQALDIPVGTAWVDPIITPVNIQQEQLMNNLTFFQMLPDIVGAIEEGATVKSTNGLSNISNGNPDHLRPILNQVYLCMLKRNGMYSCIVDAFDPIIMDLCAGKLPWFADLVYGVMDGKEYDIPSLKKEEADVVKTAKVVLGHSLFSQSWLDI
ncbi:MAG: dihydropteroate synthase [Deltaproteobacteria bacterium]|jgi:5-methyltetrahydrofolate corrinoid/iron sulfur protein methyltransferase|nr:dihydropteroate synthase [Deltaproteobacteria bacterium]